MGGGGKDLGNVAKALETIAEGDGVGKTSKGDQQQPADTNNNKDGSSGEEGKKTEAETAATVQGIAAAQGIIAAMQAGGVLPMVTTTHLHRVCMCVCSCSVWAGDVHIERAWGGRGAT